MEDFDLEQQLIQNRMKRFGQQGYQEPQGQMVGNQFVAPNILQHIAAGLRGYGAIKGQAGAEQELKDLQGKRQSAIADALRNFGDKSRGAEAFTAAGPAPEGQDQTGGYNVPARAPDMRGAYADLMAAPDASLRQAGMQGMIQMPQMEARQQERQADREFKQQEAEAARQARMDQLREQQAMRMQMLQDQNASRQQMMQSQQEFQREMKKLGGGAASQPYFQPVQTAQGVMAFNARTGRVEPVMGPTGQPVVGAAADPTLQGQLAGAKTSAQTEGKLRTEARLEAPKVVQQADEAVKLVDDLLAAPGMKQAVGGSRLFGVQKIPGTAAKDFDIRLDQLKGKQFLQAFESLKGGGAITEVEGKKATDAIARMDASGTEAEFTKAAREFQQVIRQGAERARQMGGGIAPAPVQPTGQDAEALKWARSNPNDPRSRAILQRLGQ